MKYKDLKEMTFKEWDGKPFYAIVIDCDEREICNVDKRRLNDIYICDSPLIVGYVYGAWEDKSGLRWKHAYPIEWNKKPKKRMTNRQLSMWLAKGNGEKKCENARAVDSNHIYMNDEAGEPCPDYIKVRKWYTKEWIEPTTDLLEQ